MPDMQLLLDIVLILLLAATLFHALRLERALGVLKRDRASLTELIIGFNASTRQAESGIERLRQAADGAGRQIARQAEQAGALKADLGFLIERGERLADRMDREAQRTRTPALPAAPNAGAKAAGFEEAELASDTEDGLGGTNDPARVRSQAERDLLRALKMVR